MQLSFRSVMILTTGLVLGVSLSIGQGVFAEKDVPPSPLPLQELRTFTEVFEKIKTDYVEPVGDNTLLENAVRGMLSGLDPHSAYLDADAFRELQVGTTGEFGGLGIEIGMEDGFVKVIAPIDDTPAQRAGIKAGDLIIRIEETAVKGMGLTEAVNLMRGKPGTNVTLTVVREGQDKPLRIVVTRAVIKVKSVKEKSLDKGYGYVRISQFQNHTGENLADAISRLKKENGELKGLILDLRNNPGGVLSAAVSVSDAFLEEGLVVYTEGRIKDSKMSFKATPEDLLKGAPLIVLVNSGSASASEIVAGALQDHKRAIIMGEKTFGKGSVQTILPMRNGAALKLTTARYYTPSGRSIQAEGITPDLELQNLTVASADETATIGRIKEADLTGHLQNGTRTKSTDGKPLEAKPADNTPGSNPPPTETLPVGGKENLAKTDYQLYEALNLLKGLALVNKRK